MRWAAVEAVSKNHAGGDIKAAYRRIAERRGRNIAKVADANFSPSCTTAGGTARSDAWRRPTKG